MADSGVTVGCGDDRFCPSDPVTRAQMATFMHRLSGTAPDTGPSVNAAALTGVIVGYDEQRPSPATRTGSHTLVVGPRHEWTGVGGIVAGASNNVTGNNTTVAAGLFNTASGPQLIVTGGQNNTASGVNTAVLGGLPSSARRHIVLPSRLLRRRRRPAPHGHSGRQLLEGSASLPCGAITSLEDLTGQFLKGMLARGEFGVAGCGGVVDAASPAVDEFLARGEQAVGLHAVQHGVERAGADVVAVLGQLITHPRPVDLALAGVVEDVQAHRSAPELLEDHRLPSFPFRMTRQACEVSH
jgi:hypothetical protein